MTRSCFQRPLLFLLLLMANESSGLTIKRISHQTWANGKKTWPGLYRDRHSTVLYFCQNHCLNWLDIATSHHHTCSAQQLELFILPSLLR